MKVTVVEYFVLQDSSINHELVEVSKRTRKNPDKLKKPSNAIAYRFFDSTKKLVNGKFSFVERKNFSEITFLKKYYTLKDLKSLLADFKKILPKMKANNWEKVIKLESREWQKFRFEDCIYIDPTCVYGTFAFVYNKESKNSISGIFSNSGGFDILGQVFTVDEIEKLIPTYETIISKMERDGFGSTVEIKKHNWKYLKEDKLI